MPLHISFLDQELPLGFCLGFFFASFPKVFCQLRKWTLSFKLRRGGKWAIRTVSFKDRNSGRMVGKIIGEILFFFNVEFILFHK